MAIGAGAGANSHQTLAPIEIHEHDKPPCSAVLLEGVDLVTSSEKLRQLVAVDGTDHVWKHPYDDKQFVGERLRVTHRRDARTLSVAVEISHDPLDDRVMRVVAVQESQALHRPTPVRDLARSELPPAPVATITEDALDTGAVRLKGLGDTLVPIAETDAERTIGILTLRPCGGGRRKAIEVRLSQSPLLILVCATENSELLVDGRLVRILIRNVTLLIDELKEQSCVSAVRAATHPVGVIGRAAHLLDDAERGVKLIVLNLGDGVSH